MAHIVRICAGRMACTFATVALGEIKSHIQTTLSRRIKRQSAMHLFIASARLDVPTYDRADVQQGLQDIGWDPDQSALWGTLKSATQIVATVVRVGAQAYALFNVLRGQPDVRWMAATTLLVETLPLLTNHMVFRDSGGECRGHSSLCQGCIDKCSCCIHHEEQGLSQHTWVAQNGRRRKAPQRIGCRRPCELRDHRWVQHVLHSRLHSHNAPRI